MDKNLAYEARSFGDLGNWYEGPWNQRETADGSYEVVHQATGTVLATLPDFAGPIALWMCVARDALPAFLAEQHPADAIEYGIRIPSGDVLMSGSPLDRSDQEARLGRYRDTWPEAVLVQRLVAHGDWTEADPAPTTATR